MTITVEDHIELHDEMNEDTEGGGIATLDHQSDLVIPQPERFLPADADELAAHVISWAEECTDLDAVEDARARVSAIETYFQRHSPEAARTLAITQRQLEIRIGILLGPAQLGGDRKSDQVGHDRPDLLSKDQRYQFRRIAEHKDHPEVSDACGKGASRRKVQKIIDNLTAPATAPAHEPPSQTVEVRDLVTEPPTCPLEDALDTAPLDIAARANVIEVPSHDEAAPVDREPLQIITDAVETLNALAENLEQTEPGDVPPDDLAPLVESMSDSLRRLDREHRRMKDWL